VQALSTHAAADFRASVLTDAASYAAAVPLEFLCAVLQPQVQAGLQYPVTQIAITLPPLLMLAPVPPRLSSVAVLPQDDQQVQQWRQYLQHFVYETVGRLRIGELFDIVVGALHYENR
jgi:hypothetical protein